MVKDVGEEGVVVYDQKQDKVHFLNPVAYLIWILLREKESLQKVEHEIRAKFQTEEREDVLSDIKKCIKELEEKELI